MATSAKQIVWIKFSNQNSFEISVEQNNVENAFFRLSSKNVWISGEWYHNDNDDYSNEFKFSVQLENKSPKLKSVTCSNNITTPK